MIFCLEFNGQFGGVYDRMYIGNVPPGCYSAGAQWYHFLSRRDQWGDAYAFDTFLIDW